MGDTNRGAIRGGAAAGGYDGGSGAGPRIGGKGTFPLHNNALESEAMAMNHCDRAIKNIFSS